MQRLAQEVAELQGVRPGSRGTVCRAIVKMGEGLKQFTRREQGIHSMCGSLKAVIRKGPGDDEEEGYYSSTEDESEVGEETARRGLGKAGSVTIADSIWNKCVPSDLLRKYRRRLRRTQVADSGRGHKAKVLGCMMEDVRVTTKGVKHTRRRATTTAFLRPKLKEKCRPLLNPEEVHEADARRPLRFRLPRLEGLGHWMARQRGRRRGRSIWPTAIGQFSCRGGGGRYLWSGWTGCPTGSPVCRLAGSSARRFASNWGTG